MLSLHDTADIRYEPAIDQFQQLSEHYLAQGHFLHQKDVFNPIFSPWPVLPTRKEFIFLSEKGLPAPPG